MTATDSCYWISSALSTLLNRELDVSRPLSTCVHLEWKKISNWQQKTFSENFPILHLDYPANFTIFWLVRCQRVDRRAFWPLNRFCYLANTFPRSFTQQMSRYWLHTRTIQTISNQILHCCAHPRFAALPSRRKYFGFGSLSKMSFTKYLFTPKLFKEYVDVSSIAVSRNLNELTRRQCKIDSNNFSQFTLRRVSRNLVHRSLASWVYTYYHWQPPD